MDNISNWDVEEVKTLFKYVEVKKSEGMPLIQIFAEYAKCTHRHKNSVRNYYYKELANIKNNLRVANIIGIDINNHKVNKGIPFSKEEEDSLVKKIDSLIDNGYSVRKACLELSEGNVPKMLRLQNKYRSLIKKDKGNSNMGQIIKMPVTNNRITDEDIKALFMGLVKLVKKQEQENAKALYESELFKANEKLKLAMNNLIVKQNEIDTLNKKIELIKVEINCQNENSIKKRVNDLNKKSASSLIKSYFKNEKICKKQVQK